MKSGHALSFSRRDETASEFCGGWPSIAASAFRAQERGEWSAGKRNQSFL
jgi:hypothetical protein